MIYECCPFYNENLIASVKIIEDQQWLDELHITEANKTFTYNDKNYHFDCFGSDIIKYHQVNVTDIFKKDGFGFSRKPWFVRHKNYAWHNEGVQRNLSRSWIKPDPNDIVILSDIDEIIDRGFIDRIIEEVKKRQIITIKLYFTLYYFNLFSKNWSGAPDYSYRIFIMTGDYFNKMKITSDKFRKLGEQGKLVNDVYCLNEFAGFHHSWLGDKNFIAKKITAYAHDRKDHDKQLFKSNGDVDMSYVEMCLRNCQSIFGEEHELYKDESINLLESVDALRDRYPDFFIN